MTATHAANTQVRRPVAQPRPNAPVARTMTPERSAPVAPRPAVAVAAAAIGFDDHEDDFRLNLRDIPRMPESLDVEGLKPSLLSRLLDIVVPLKP